MADPTTTHTGHVELLIERLRVMLGLVGRQPTSLTDALRLDGLRMDDDGPTSPGAAYQPTDLPDDALQPMPAAEYGSTSPRDIDRLSQQVSFLRDGVVNPSILRAGVTSDNYRVVEGRDGRGFNLLFRPDDAWTTISHHEDKEDAVAAANQLRRHLADLSLRSEGLHIVEHLLLRPPGDATADRSMQSDPGPDFWSFRVSVLMPSWTKRFADRRFQRLAAELLAENLPAHVAPSIHWLTYAKMVRFEDLSDRWRAALAEPGTDLAEVGRAAAELARFLHGLSESEVGDRGGEVPS